MNFCKNPHNNCIFNTEVYPNMCDDEVMYEICDGRLSKIIKVEDEKEK